MKIAINEIKDQETLFDFSENDPWVAKAVRLVDECKDDKAYKSLKRNSQPQKDREVSVHFSLRKVDEVFVISGKMKTQLHLLCSRCANPYAYSCAPKFSSLYCRDPHMAGIAHLQAGKPSGQRKGHARHAHENTDPSETDNLTFSEQSDIDITYLTENFIDLSDIITEQLQLQVPFQPLCKESCKGMCPQCGADLNIGRCACQKVAPISPFSVLKDFSIKTNKKSSKSLNKSSLIKKET